VVIEVTMAGGEAEEIITVMGVVTMQATAVCRFLSVNTHKQS